MSSYRSGSVGRFDYPIGSGLGSSSSRYRPSQTPASSSYSSSRYSSSSTANPITSSSAGIGVPRSYRAASYDPFSDKNSRSTITSYRSPYNRESGSGLDRPSAATSTMSNSYSDYTSKSRFGGGVSDRYGGGGYKPSTTSMSNSYTSALQSSSSISSVGNRYKGSSTTANFPPPRSTSYGSGLSFEPTTSSTSRYSSGIPGRTSTLGMSSSTYTPSSTSTSYYSRPRIDYRSQTPSSITREPPTTSRFDREYRSMSRFDVKEPSVDRVEETFSKLYNRYVRGSEKEIKTPSSSSSSTTSSNQNSPIVKKFISHSEAEEEEFSCESEPEIIPLHDYTKTLQKTKVAFTLPPEKKENKNEEEAKEKTPTPGTVAPKKEILTSSSTKKTLAATDKSADKSLSAAAVISSSPSSQQQKVAAAAGVQQQPPLAATTKISAAIKSKETPSEMKGSSTKTTVSTATPPAKAASPIPSKSKAETSRSKSPALTKASFEEKYKDILKTEVIIEPKQIKGTSELDKLLRIAEFEKNPNKILSGPIPKAIQSAVKASTPSPAPVKSVIEKPVKAASEAPADSHKIAATVKVKESIPAASAKTKEVGSKVIKEKTPEPSKRISDKKEKTPEPTSKATISVTKKENSEKPRSRSKSPAPSQGLRSRSKSPSGKSSSAAPEKQSLASKRAQRRERTIEMEKYVQNKLEQVKQEQEAADKVTELPKVTSERKPPLLLVTQPSVPSTPISLSANIVWNSNSGEHGSESEWDEEDEDEEEEAEDEEFYSEDDYDFTISLPSATAPGAPRGDLYPVDDSRLRSITPYSDYDSEFEIPFIQPDSRNDSRGRVSQSNAAPPPIFLASVTYDGHDEWGSKHSADSDPDESQYFTVGSRLGVDSAGSRTYLSPVDFPSEEDEYLDNVDVGCTLTLLDKAAMKGSDEETDSEFYSEYSDEEEFTEEEYSYYEEEEEYYTDEEIEEEVDEEWEDDIEMTASLYLPPTFEKSKSPEPQRSKTPEPSSAKIEVKKEATSVKKVETKANTPEPKTVTKEKTPEPKKAEIKKEKTPEPSKSVTKEKTPEPKKIETKTNLSKDKTPEPSKTSSTKAKTPEPNAAAKKESEVVKKVAEIKKAKTPEPSKTLITKEKTPEPKKTETKTDMKSTVSKVEPTKTVPKPTETASTKPKTASATMLAISSGPKGEDKSAIRKSTLNMAEIERKKAEEKQAEIDRQNARLSGAVSSMRDKFRDPTPPKQEKITYRRSKLLQAREEIRPKRTYAPIIKPVLNDEFDKQMEEIREKMKKGSHKLQAEYTNLSKGINSEVDERKLKSLESKHKDLIGNTQTLLTKAEEEKKRFINKNESEIEKRHREALEKEEAKFQKLEEEKRAAMLVRPEPKRTVRRSKKKAEEEAAKAGLTEPLIPPSSSETSASKKEGEIKTAAPPAPRIPALLPKKEETTKISSLGTAAATKVVEPKKIISTSKVPSFIPEAKKDDSDLEFIAAAMAKKKPMTVSDSVMKSEAGGVAALLRRKAEKAASPIPSSTEAATEKASPDKAVERGPRRYSARRKTEEIIPPSKIIAKENERKRKVQPHRKNRYTRKPFDIDALLGWEKENESFEKMEAFFETHNFKREPSSPLNLNGISKIKKRRIEAQKVWISELKDIDKIYKASELRDIKMTAVS